MFYVQQSCNSWINSCRLRGGFKPKGDEESPLLVATHTKIKKKKKNLRESVYTNPIPKTRDSRQRIVNPLTLLSSRTVSGTDAHAEGEFVGCFHPTFCSQFPKDAGNN